MYAAQCGQVDIAKYLCSAEIDSDIYIKSHLSGRDAMTIATEARFDKIVDILNITDK